MRAPKTFVT